MISGCIGQVYFCAPASGGERVEPGCEHAGARSERAAGGARMRQIVSSELKLAGDAARSEDEKE